VQGNPARWAPDPLARHEYRYWDGTQWTEHVSDAGTVGIDPPVAGPAPTPANTPTTPANTPPIPANTPPESAGWAAPTGPATAPTPATPGVPTAPASGFGGTHLGAPLPGSGATAMAAGWTAPPTHDATAVLGRRYGAFLIDATISIVVFTILFFASATTHTRAEMLRVPGCHLSANDSSQVECDNRAVVTVNDKVYEADFWPWAGLCVLFTLLYFAVMEGFTGASPGKHMTGLRVVTPAGERIGFPRALARWALFAIDGPLSLFLCGIITSAVSAGHRRLGDMAANSYVIGKIDAGRPVAVRPR
jgi:uncharacterized RDD family membrane protein YckC